MANLHVLGRHWRRCRWTHFFAS